MLALLAPACHREPPAERDSIVLVTLGNLRPDAIGALGGPDGWTPRLDRWIEEADWAGTAVASSSIQTVSLTSLMTGVSPWQHQVLTGAPASPRPGLSLLAQALGRIGYATTAFVPTSRRFRSQGLLAGFDRVRAIDSGRALRDELGAPGDEPRFVWIHVPEIDLPYDRRDGRQRLRADAPELPDRLGGSRLLRFTDPALPLPARLRADAWELYLHEVSRVDDRLGELLDLLRASPRWRRAWVVLTAAHGTELGEHDQILYGQNLGRASIEVPLVIDLPAAARPLAVADNSRPGLTRLWATLVEAAGGAVPPVHAPSLFRAVEPPTLSELYLRDGVNLFSLAGGELQVIWSARFAPSEPGFYSLWERGAGAERGLRRRLERRFTSTRPLRGEGPAAPRLRLERWRDGGTEPVTDRAAAERLAGELYLSWLRFVGRERTPEEEAAPER